MKRWLYAYRDVDGDEQRLQRTLLQHSDKLLAAATNVPDGEHSGDGSFLVDVPGHVAGVDMAKRVRVSIGVAAQNDTRTVLPLTWRAESGTMLFPRFSGTLEWQPLDRHRGQVTLVGAYDPPLGWVGGAIDATFLRHVSHATAQRLVDAVADELEDLATAGEDPTHARPRQHGPLRVSAVMTPNPIALDESMPLRTGALVLFHAEISGAPVLAADGRLVGVLSESDLLAKEADPRAGWGRGATAERQRRDALTVGEACSSPARLTAPETRLAAAAREMLDHDVSRLIVVAEGRVVGIVTRHDVLAALIRDDHGLLSEVRRQLDAQGFGSVNAAIEWGHVTLSGTTQLRSDARTARRVAARVDGVMSVEDDDVDWVVDDVKPPMAVPF